MNSRFPPRTKLEFNFTDIFFSKLQESNSLSGGEETSIYDSNSLQSGDSYDSGLAKSHRRMGSNVSTGKF